MPAFQKVNTTLGLPWTKGAAGVTGNMNKVVPGKGSSSVSKETVTAAPGEPNNSQISARDALSAMK